MTTLVRGRTSIVRMMQKLEPPVFRINGTVLYQALATPHDIAATTSAGSYPRVTKLTAQEAIVVQGATERAKLMMVSPVGSAATTPVLAALMSVDATWEVNLNRDGVTFVPAKVLEADTDTKGVGWEILVEVVAS